MTPLVLLIRSDLDLSAAKLNTEPCKPVTNDKAHLPTTYPAADDLQGANATAYMGSPAMFATASVTAGSATPSVASHEPWLFLVPSSPLAALESQTRFEITDTESQLPFLPLLEHYIGLPCYRVPYIQDTGSTLR